jgi:DNA invertase Pin-like site-specific DNA recombinase
VLVEDPHHDTTSERGRVSTLDQHADMQVEAIRRAAGERGWKLVAEQVDAGVSGGRDRRPALDALLEQA